MLQVVARLMDVTWMSVEYDIVTPWKMVYWEGWELGFAILVSRGIVAGCHRPLIIIVGIGAWQYFYFIIISVSRKKKAIS